MKKCPACNREYDDEVRFCLEDGATLVRTAESGQPTMTMPVAHGFQPPPPPTLVMPKAPSMPVGRTLLNIFVAPGRALTSFRDVTTFSPAAVRFLIAAPIILIAIIAYNALYLVRIGSDNITRAGVEATRNLRNLPPDQKERAIQMAQNPAYRGITLVMSFGQMILLTLASMPLGALIYWVGAMIFKSRLKYMQALLIWTYATLPATVLWLIVNVVTLFVWPPSNDVAIATGAAGVFPSNLGALFTVELLPIPVHVAALSAFDVFKFYGLALAVFGLRKVANIPLPGAFAIVAFVWLLGVMWLVSTAGLASALLR